MVIDADLLELAMGELWRTDPTNEIEPDDAPRIAAAYERLLAERTERVADVEGSPHP